MARPQAAPSVPLAVVYARSLLERQGLAKYRHSSWLANALGLSYAQAHRRLNGTSPWSLEDLAQLASMFGESLSDLFAAAESQTAVTALLQTGGEMIPCQVWLGDPIATPARGSVYAVRSTAGWIVATMADRLAGDAFSITRLLARPAGHRRPTVAVLDDDRDITDSLVSSFDSLGYSARPFYRAADLLAASSTTYDGFVLDWVVGEGTVLELVRSLRASNASCPIIILTAQVATGVVKETVIAEAMQHYNLLFCEKPVRASILAAMLSRAFASKSDPTRAQEPG